MSRPNGARARLGKLPCHHKTLPVEPIPGKTTTFKLVSKKQCKCGWPKQAHGNYFRHSQHRKKDESNEECWQRIYDTWLKHTDGEEHDLKKPSGFDLIKQQPSLKQLCAAVDAPAERLLARLSLRQASPAHIVDVSRTIKLCRDVVRVGAPTLERKRRKESGAGCVGEAGGSGDGGVGGGGTIVGSGGSAGANDRTSDRQAKRHKSVPQVSLPLLPPAAPGRPAPRRPPRPRRCPPPAHDLWPTCPASLPSPRQRSQCKRCSIHSAGDHPATPDHVPLGGL